MFLQNPRISSFTPDSGPKAGGTSLTIEGSELMTGDLNNIRVSIDGFNATNLSVTDSRLVI